MNFKFQISNFKFILVVLLGIAFTSCEKVQKEFYLTDLQGLWLEDGTQHYVRFTTISADRADYLWGYEWDEGDPKGAVYESDVLDDQYGNGWFMYRLNQSELLEIHKMSGGDWADIPKSLILTLLTNSKMTYYPKDYKNEKHYFTKQ